VEILSPTLARRDNTRHAVPAAGTRVTATRELSVVHHRREET